MTEELEALEFLEKFFNSRKNYEPNNKFIFDCITYLNNIKQALQRLEAIDNANPSEALECLKSIGNIELSHIEYTEDEDFDGNWVYDEYEEFDGTIKENYEKEYNTIKQALLKAQEQEKVLEIVFRKRIDLESFYTTFVENNYDYNYYEEMYGTYGKYKLTQEEFDLLKRWLDNGL